ncbi:outer membrane protein assembly factor BamD [Paucibacter aquatile]|uniref:Outer membrane protein assembly factor BamD n=1 Tax=Kinneretia aquatilis TaxID=2070761 RepID=A0A2N8KVP7_9BURK|nr:MULTISPECIES: outer membrane protein assembly factor BamD [Roseateles]PND37525.1 outer membrane protein assembly factor BamD [Paucibacter aquatile]
MPQKVLPQVQTTAASSAAWRSGFLAAVALALAACSSAPKDDPNSQASLDKLYAEAKDDLSSGSYDRAIKSLERIEGRAAGTIVAQQAQLDLAWAYHKSGERAQAVSTLDRFIKLNPSSPAMDYALYMKGLVNFNEDLGLFGRLANQDIAERDQQASRDAMLAFKQLIDQFPDSKYAAEARVRVDYITNTLAVYEVHVARYYYNRGAYLAAANRAQQAVQEFQRAPAAEEALFIMTQSYDKLDLPALRDDAKRVLEKSFPNSAYLSGNYDGGKKAWWRFW